MNLFAIETGRFALDGGAMFGVVPKSIWERTNPADNRNLIPMAMRALLVEDGGRLILIDNGLGHKYDQKFAQLYNIDHSSASLDLSLSRAGFSRGDITDIFLTHLHFDHCGGSTEWDVVEEKSTLVFPDAIHWIQKTHLDWALHPNPREKASFFDDNIAPLVQSSNLRLLTGETELFPGFQVKVINGHTEGQQLPLITYKEKKILYAADLFPTHGHIPLPFVMGYDTRPLLTLSERESILPWLAKEEVVLFFEHDPQVECGTVLADDKGKYRIWEKFLLSSL